MHSFHHGDRFTIHSNSDMSGDCIIVDHEDERELRVPGVLLLEFVAAYVAVERVSAIEQMSAREVLGLSG